MRLNRLKKRSDFLKVATEGARCSTHSLNVQMAQTPTMEQLQIESDGNSMRVGFTATKKLGSAVIRNRAKRRMRAAAAKILPQYGRPGTDYVLIARNLCVTCPFDALCRDLIYALKRLHAS